MRNNFNGFCFLFYLSMSHKNAFGSLLNLIMSYHPWPRSTTIKLNFQLLVIEGSQLKVLSQSIFSSCIFPFTLHSTCHPRPLHQAKCSHLFDSIIPDYQSYEYISLSCPLTHCQIVFCLLIHHFQTFIFGLITCC